MAEIRPRRRKIRDEIAALKRERTLDAATDLFYERGYHNTTLDDVAERLGVAKPFIYTNFGSKSALLAEICSRGINAAMEEIEQALTLNLSPAETLRVFLPRYVAAVLRSQKHIAINIREEKNLEPEDAERLAALRQTFMARIEGLLQSGQGRGEFKVADSRLAAFAIVGAVSWTTFWYNPGGYLSREAVAKRMTAVILSLAGDRQVDPSPP